MGELIPPDSNPFNSSTKDYTFFFFLKTVLFLTSATLSLLNRAKDFMILNHG